MNNEESIKSFEYTCADPRGACGFVQVDRLRALLRRKTVELKKAEEEKKDPNVIREIGIKYELAAQEVAHTIIDTLQMLRTELYRTYEKEFDGYVIVGFGAFPIAKGEEGFEEIWNKIKDFYKDYCKDEEPLRIIKYRGCYFPELNDPYGMSSGIVVPASMRKISEFFGMGERVENADPREYLEVDSLFDWDYVLIKEFDVHWLFNPSDNSKQANEKLKKCFDENDGNIVWYCPEKWYEGLVVKKPNAADIADGKKILE